MSTSLSPATCASRLLSSSWVSAALPSASAPSPSAAWLSPPSPASSCTSCCPAVRRSKQFSTHPLLYTVSGSARYPGTAAGPVFRAGAAICRLLCGQYCCTGLRKAPRPGQQKSRPGIAAEAGVMHLLGHSTISSVPAPMSTHPINDFGVNFSCRNTNASTSVKTRLNLSTGTTLQASPSCSAL